MEEKLYNLTELTQIYRVNRKTLLRWVDELNFPLFTISPYKRYARVSAILAWENSLSKTLHREYSGENNR